MSEVSRIFKLTWDESLGAMWMNADNLRSCLLGRCCAGVDVDVEDVTDRERRREVSDERVQVHDRGRL